MKERGTPGARKGELIYGHEVKWNETFRRMAWMARFTVNETPVLVGPSEKNRKVFSCDRMVGRELLLLLPFTIENTEHTLFFFFFLSAASGRGENRNLRLETESIRSTDTSVARSIEPSAASRRTRPMQLGGKFPGDQILQLVYKVTF